MIISHIIGGLGNQMFQYAAGRNLSLATGQALRLDLRDFKNYKLHQGFELSRVFEVDVQPITPGELFDILGWRSGRLALKLLKRLPFPSVRGTNLLIEPHFHYWERLSGARGQNYLMGYWQSERYFSVFADTIREEFRFRVPLDDRNREISDSMRCTQSVSLHVRRSDYISHKKTSEIMCVQDIDYYRKAVRHLSQKLNSPRYYVFSDDMRWAKQALDFLPNAVMIDHNCGVDSYKDMQLMACCKHNIIANSTFSWWGAWLNPNPEKCVIAPRAWFLNGLNDCDLVPPDWTRL